MTPVRDRPANITIVAIIAFVQAAIGSLAAVGLLVERHDTALLAHVNVTSQTVTTYAVVALLVAAITFLVAVGLWRAAGWARGAVAIVQIIQIGLGLYLLVSWRGIYVWNAIIEILVALLALWLLFGVNSDEFFARRGS